MKGWNLPTIIIIILYFLFFDFIIIIIIITIINFIVISIRYVLRFLPSCLLWDLYVDNNSENQIKMDCCFPDILLAAASAVVPL